MCRLRLIMLDDFATVGLGRVACEKSQGLAIDSGRSANRKLELIRNGKSACDFALVGAKSVSRGQERGLRVRDLPRIP
jgi:hypothetical protein